MLAERMRLVGFVCYAVAAAVAASCGGNEDTGSGATSSATGTTSSSAATTGTGASGGAGGGSSSASVGSGGAGGAGGSTTIYAAMVRGTLASTDLATAKAAHDAIAQGGQQAAMQAGDIAHDVLLGTTMLDSVENEFFAFDRWTDADAMKAFYANPMVQQAFSSLFASPPTIEYFVYEPTWVSWGNMDSGDAYNPYYWHLALGVLADKDTAQAKAHHDAVASGGQQPAIAAGNLAHIVYLGLDDSSRFVGVDIWGSSDNIVPFYTNPQFVAAFAPLFESVTQPVYQSTDWYQW